MFHYNQNFFSDKIRTYLELAQDHLNLFIKNVFPKTTSFSLEQLKIAALEMPYLIEGSGLLNLINHFYPKNKNTSNSQPHVLVNLQKIVEDLYLFLIEKPDDISALLLLSTCYKYYANIWKLVLQQSQTLNLSDKKFFKSMEITANKNALKYLSHVIEITSKFNLFKLKPELATAVYKQRGEHYKNLGDEVLSEYNYAIAECYKPAVNILPEHSNQQDNSPIKEVSYNFKFTSIF